MADRPSRNNFRPAALVAAVLRVALTVPWVAAQPAPLPTRRPAARHLIEVKEGKTA